jgi:hypothetical protein
MGRHSAPDEDDVALAAARDAGTRGDLALLRHDPAVRARCIAGAVVPLVLYTIVLIAVGRVAIFLLWVWAPIVVSGVLVGVFLDLGYRGIDRPAETPGLPEPGETVWGPTSD